MINRCAAHPLRQVWPMVSFLWQICARGLVCLLVVVAATLYAASPALAGTARVQLVVPDLPSFTAGERIPLAVELLAKGQFSGPTYFDLPEVEGAIIMQVSQRPVLGTQSVDGETYAMSRHEFALYPQRAGKLQVPAFMVRFGSRERYDAPVQEYQLSAESFTINVIAPAGALPGEIILSATSVQATETWSPKPVEAVVGDAFTRTITLQADGVVAMLLPEPNFVDIEGLASYIRAPQLADQTERGAFMGKRIDTVTYVCEQAGVFEIPELSVRWWDPVEGAWHHREFPAVQLEVAVNPLLIADSASWTIDELPAEWTDWVWRAAGMVILLLLLIKLAPGVLRRYLGWLEHWSHTEPAYWNRLLKAFKKAEPAQLYGALNQWLGLLGLATTHISMQLDADVSDQLAAECIGLQQNLVGMGAHWNANIFRDELTRFRRCKRSTAGSKLNHALPPLNPTRTALG